MATGRGLDHVFSTMMETATMRLADRHSEAAQQLEIMLGRIGPITSRSTDNNDLELIFDLSARPKILTLAQLCGGNIAEQNISHPLLNTPGIMLTIPLGQNTVPAHEHFRKTLVGTLPTLENCFFWQPAQGIYTNPYKQTWAAVQESQLPYEEKLWRRMTEIGTLIFVRNLQDKKIGSLYAFIGDRPEAELALLMQEVAQQIGGNPHEDVRREEHPIQEVGQAIALQVDHHKSPSFRVRAASLPNIFIERGLDYVRPTNPPESLAMSIRRKIHTPMQTEAGPYRRIRYVPDDLIEIRDETFVLVTGFDLVERGILRMTSGMSVAPHPKNLDVMVFIGPKRLFNANWGPLNGHADIIADAHATPAPAPAPAAEK
jgi:hypothetical protein